MKFGYTIIGIFLALTAIVFARSEARILDLFTAEKDWSAPADSTVGGKKKPAKASTKLKKKTGAQASPQYYFFQPEISATKTVDKTTGAVSGDLLNYTVTIFNTGTSGASGLTFNDYIDPNTTLVEGSVKTSPVAFDDTYNALGNVGISVPAANGILTNDDLGTNPQAVLSEVSNAATTQGGSISISANGSFSYTPAAGFTGNDTYTYSLTNAAGSSSAVITISVSGMIWFISNNSAAATADGRINTPFKTIAAFQAVNDGVGLHPKAGHAIFVSESSTAYDGNITLLNGQKLIGQDATTDLATITGYTAFTYSTPLLPILNSSNATVANLTATGATNVVTLNGGTEGSYTIRGVTIGNKVNGSGITGTSFGTVNISETNIIGTGQALALSTGLLNATFPNLSSSSGVNAISLTGIAGTLIIESGTLAGSTGATLHISGGSVNLTDRGNITQANNAAMVNVAGGHSGTLAFQTGTLSATNGTGLQFNTANGTYQFNGTTILNGGDAGVDIVGTSLGSFVFGANTSISNPTGTAFNIGAAGAGSGGSGSVTYQGSISKTSGGRAIEIQNKTAGTVAFSGAISSTSTSSGINLVNNSGATINFTGGLLLNTGANTAFNATGGGTVSVTQNNSTIVNTITTTTATAVNVLNTTIGAAGLAFRSINVNGATKGVSLNNTGSGGFSITGTGNTAGSGGTIQNISQRGIEIISAQNISLNNVNFTNANTADAGLAGVCEELSNGGCFAALYISATTTVALHQLNITNTEEQGINLNNVTDLAISNCTVQGNGNGTEEGALKAIDLKGICSITNSIFKNSAFRIAHIRNNSGNVHLTVSGSQFINDATNLSVIKQDCFQMRVNNSATATILISNSTFKRAGTAAVQVYAQDNSIVHLAITGCTADREGTLMKGIEVGSDHTATMNANVDGNPLITADGEVALNINSGTASTTNATARNNTSIKGGNNPNLNAFAVVRVFAFAASNNRSLVSGNAVTDLDAQGILSGSSNSSGAGTSTINSTVQNNTITGTSGLTGSGIRVPTSTNNAAALTSNCSYITGNTVTVITPTDHLRIVGGSSSSAVLLPSTGNSAASVWNNNSNTPSSPPAVITVQQIPGSTITFGGAPCPQPSNLVLPTRIASTDAGQEVDKLDVVHTPVLEPEHLVTASLINESEGEGESAESKADSSELTNLHTTEPDAAVALVETTPQNVTVSGISLPAAKSITIIFQVTVNNSLPVSVCSISNQGSVSGNTITTVLTDNDGNNSNGVNPTITTIQDNTIPVVNNCPGTVTVQAGNSCTQTASWTEPTGTDNCSGALTYFSRSHAPGATFSKGTTTVTYVFKDAAGNQASCNFDVIVEDQTGPVISSCPTTVTVQTGAGNTTCNKTATWTEPTATDACDGPVAYFSRSHAPGSVFSVGTTAVTYVFKDVAGNQSTCTFNVVVEDNTAPVVSGCPTTVTVQTGAGNTTCTRTATWTEPTATDNCGSGPLTYFSRSHAPGSTFSKGTTTVTYVFKDAAGNSSNCVFDVVVEDNTPPLLTCPGNVTVIENPSGSGSATVNYTAATATDNCSGIGVIQYSKASGTSFPLGTTTVNVSVQDASGNLANCSFTVTVDPACQITPPSNISVSNAPGQCGAVVNYPAASTTGDCGPLTYSHASGSFFPVGTTVVTISSLSTGQSNNFTITVNDNAPPVISNCPSNITAQTGPGNTTCGKTVSWTPPTATDNCGGTLAPFSVSHQPGASFNVGQTTVTYRFRDAAQNESVCSFVVTVQDNTLPVITGCPQNIVTNVVSGCTKTVSWTAPTAADNCGSPTLVSNYASGASFPVGITTVTYSATDGAGNIGSCSFTVEVRDLIPPAFTTNLTANPVVIWPPDHKMKNIDLTYATADNCAGPITNLVTVTSTDPISGVMDGDKFPDWEVVNDRLVKLRAERGNGREARIYTITVTPRDAAGNLGQPRSVNVHIAHNITAPVTGSSFKVGSTVDFTGVFWDKAGNRHTAQWLIDENLKAKGTVTEPEGSKNGKVTGSYRFSTPGIYKLQMNVTDQTGLMSYANTNEDMEAIVVVYDPNGGFTYGGGWFHSPAGALNSDPTATGKVNYGFTVNYYKGASNPKGETQFDFKVGDLEFNALNFDYLVISGAKAQFRGTGKIIGGQSGIGFIMTVIDGDLDGTGVDKVRVKIFNKVNGHVFYDSQPNASEAADPAIAVGSNSSVTISGSGAGPTVTKPMLQEHETDKVANGLKVQALPNPTFNYFTLVIQSGDTKTVQITISDAAGRVVELRPAIPPNGALTIGQNYRPGIYFAEIVQGKEKVTVKLVKQPD